MLTPKWRRRCPPSFSKKAKIKESQFVFLNNFSLGDVVSADPSEKSRNFMSEWKSFPRHLANCSFYACRPARRGAHCTGYKLWGERGSFFYIDFPNSNKRYLSLLIILPPCCLVALCVFLLQLFVLLSNYVRLSLKLN